MKIEGNKSLKFRSEIIEVWKNKPESIADFQVMAESLASELMKTAIRNATHNKKYFGNAIEISVAVSIGDPEEE